MTPAELVAWVQRSRAAQGLTPVITDVGILARVATLAFAGDQEGEGGGGRAP